MSEERSAKSKKTYAEAKAWAQNFYVRTRDKIDKHENGIIQLSPKEYKQYKLWDKMSEEDLIQWHYRIHSFKETQEISDEEFQEMAPELGYTEEALISTLFKERLNEYLTYYKIDAANPGLSYIVRQCVQDEFEMNKIRREISLLEADYYSKNENREELRKKLNDTLDKINKRLYEYTKHLTNERDAAVQREMLEKMETENSLEVKVDQIILHEDIEGIYKQAMNLRREKEKQIIEEDLDLHDG